MSTEPRSKATKPRTRTAWNGRRGSAVITVLVLAAVTAVIASGFLFRSAQEAKLAGRTLLQSVALNLAEAGIEEGLHAANSGGFSEANGWALASGSATSYVKTINSGFDLDQATGSIHIRVDGGTSLAPVVIAAGVVTVPNQPKLVKQIRVGGTKRRLSANGIISKGKLTFSGSTMIDSYNSSLGPFNSATNRSDNVTVASASTALDPVVVGSSASIYGYVATTGAEPVVGAGGRIYGATTPEGTNVDSSRIRYDFTSNFPDATAPAGTAITLANITADLTLPRVGDTAGANGRYLYTTSAMTLGGNDVVAIKGPVDLIVTGNISVSGTASVSVGGTGSTNPSFNVYCPGTIAMGGNGMLNQTAVPVNMTIWGTAVSPATQSISITGNGSYTGTIYAPNASLSLGGSGDTSGAMIANTVTVGGNGKFHFDTQLSQVEASLDPSYRINSWAELSGATGGGGAFARDDREPFASIF